jgi:hypothetical protein
MTTQKGFKRVVRARMAKTGERYAAARRALLEPTAAARDNAPAYAAAAGAQSRPGYDFRGGLHPDTAVLASVLANRGVTSGLTREPLSEAAILGIGGGLGAGYILWEFKARGGPILTLGFRNQWQYPAIPGWLGKTAERLGVMATPHETGGAGRARETLDVILERHRSVIAYVDGQEIGTWAQPASLSGYRGYPVVVAGRTDDGGYLVDDRGSAALVVPSGTMSAARGRISSYRNRLVEVAAEGQIASERLRKAFREGLADQVEHLGAASDSFSLPAWRKWARLMTDTRNAKAWPRVFGEGEGLFSALMSIVEDVDGGIGAEGGHLRELYAEFLDEAAAALDAPALGDAATQWRGVADLWEDLVDAAVPADLPGASDAVEAAEELHDAVMEGEPGRGRARAAAEAMWGMRERYADSFPLPRDRIEGLFADLGRRVGEIYEAEREALATTAAATPR